MKLKIDDFEVEIKARSMGSEKMNEKDAAYFLNFISMALSDAALFNNMQGNHVFGKTYSAASNDIDTVSLPILRK